MSKRTPSSKKSRRVAAVQPTRAGDGKPPGSQPPAKASRWHAPSPAAIRETIESVVIAFVLAFLFRTFEAEAFVIPTGSMAPTLMGRHKDLICEKCGYPYRVSASDEVDNDTGKTNGMHVGAATCPMCRFTMDVSASNPHGKDFRSYKGDRILVGKFCHQFHDPQRWDVAVFRFPGGAKTNYIKRLVGLPGETISIRHGDIYVQREDRPKVIARKPPEKLLAMLQIVFDNDYMPAIKDLGWRTRWRAFEDDLPGAWYSADDQSFETDGSAAGETWIRYEHRVPSYDQWLQRPLEPAPGSVDPGRSLISDFCAYNTNRAVGRHPAPDAAALGLHWVGDLALQCTMDVKSDSGAAIFELVEGGWRFRCRIDVATGTATLDVVDADESPARTLQGEAYRLSAPTDLRGPGRYEILFANCDDQLRLWIDGELVEFGPSDAATRYAPLSNTVPKDGARASDLAPVGIGSRGAALRVDHLKIFRDIYYIARRQGGANGTFSDFIKLPGPSNNGRFLSHFRAGGATEDILDLLLESSSSRWDAAFDPANMNQISFYLDADQFLALGDNSAKSKDSRLWANTFLIDQDCAASLAQGVFSEKLRRVFLENGVSLGPDVRIAAADANGTRWEITDGHRALTVQRTHEGWHVWEKDEYYVKRELLIGKALYIYWPHSRDKVTVFGKDIPFPFFPHFSRMGYVR